MSIETTNKPSLSVENLIPNLDSPNFLTFVKAYYEWMESSSVILKDLSGSFTLGETLVGSTSFASGCIKQIDGTTIVLKMFSKESFDVNEVVQGNTSSTTATTVSVKDNVLRAADNMVQNKSFDYASGEYYEYLKSELNRGIPAQTESDRRLIAKKIKEFYSSKSTEEAYKFFFKAVFDDDVIFRFPGEEILRVSDGKFEKRTVLRTSITDKDSQPIDVFSFLNKTISGVSSGAVANVVNVRITFLGGIQFAEFVLTLTSGTFQAGEEVFAVGTPSLNVILFGMVSDFTIVDSGSGYSVGDLITVTDASGNGKEVEAEVSSINSSPINKINVDSIGHGYRLGTRAVTDNTNAGGSGFLVEVTEIKNPYTITNGGDTYTVGEIATLTIVNRGENYTSAPTLTLIDTVIESIGALSDKLITINNAGDDYAVGDTLVFSSGTATGLVASVSPSASTSEFAFEDDFNLSFEGESGILINDDPLVDGLGPISRIELTDFGTGYTNQTLPTIDMTGSGDGLAVLTVTGIQGSSGAVSVDAIGSGSGLGSIREIEIKNFGVNYSTTQTTATVNGGDGNAIITPIVSGLGIQSGDWTTTDSIIGRRVIQDSLFFQDFSYVIRSGLGFNDYRSIVKDTLHPAGTQFFGEILISTLLTVSPEFYSIIAPEFSGTSRTIFLETLLSFVEPITQDRSQYVIKKPSVTSIQQLSSPSTPSYNIEIHGNKIDATAIVQNKYNVSFGGRDSVVLGIVNNSSTIGKFHFVKSQSNVEVKVVDPLDVAGPLYKDLEISVLASSQISSFKNKTFLDQYSTGRGMYIQDRITGTVSISGSTTVTGTGTSFLTDFVAGEYIIIGNEKFKITNITNDLEMVVNVQPDASYSNVEALREYLL